MISTWECKIGGPLEESKIPPQFDNLARAILKALYFTLVGDTPDFVISDWDGALTESQRKIMHERYPDTPEYQ